MKTFKYRTSIEKEKKQNSVRGGITLLKYLIILCHISPIIIVSAGFHSTTDFEDDDNILEGVRYEKDAEYHDLEKLFERKRERNDLTEDEDVEENFPDEDEDDDYEFNGNHKSDLNEEVVNEATTELKQDERQQQTIAQPITTTITPTTSKPTAAKRIMTTTFVNKLPFHPRHKIIRHRYHSNNPMLRAILSYYKAHKSGENFNLRRNYRYREDSDDAESGE